jgi:hypothetical protein
MPTPAQVVGVL